MTTPNSADYMSPARPRIEQADASALVPVRGYVVGAGLCYRVTVRQLSGRIARPIVQALNEADLLVRVDHLYPESEVLSLAPLHATTEFGHSVGGRPTPRYRVMRPKRDRRTGDRRQGAVA